MIKPQILAIDDDLNWLGQIPLIFEDHATVAVASSVDAGVDQLSRHYFDVIILDLNFDGDDRTGSNIFSKIHSVANGADILVISGETNHRRLIDVFNTGVSKFLPKPSLTQEIRRAVQEILDNRSRRSRIKSIVDSKEVALIGSSRAMQVVKNQIDQLIKANSKDILITGESGTGKEVVTKYIVTQSGTKNYCPIHCGSITDSLADSELFGHVKGAFTGAQTDRVGAFELAMGGFIFLDEIGEMPLSQQVKLLRVLQERTIRRVGATAEKSVQFRMIAATNRNLNAMIAKGAFREDLFFRISKEVINLPPLRERKEDIPELVEYFIKLQFSHKNLEITQEALVFLQKYSWPGNVRELSAIVERLANRADRVIRGADVALALPELNYKQVGGKKKNVIVAERERFKQALLASDYDRAKAAEKLGISRATYFRRAKQLGLISERRDSNSDLGTRG